MTDRNPPQHGRAEGPASLRFPVREREDINTFVHYYRGELGRMVSWRDRLDRTTNWAIGAVAAMLSVALGSPASHQGVLLFAMVLVYLLLHIEARRYRFFHVFRTRVRLLERNYYAPFFEAWAADPGSGWAQDLANSLRRPAFTITLRQAMARRLRRNYCWIFLILLGAWLLKTTAIALRPQAGRAEFVSSAAAFLDNAAVGVVPGVAVLAGVAVFYGWLAYLMVRHRAAEGELAGGGVHV